MVDFTAAGARNTTWWSSRFAPGELELQAVMLGLVCYAAYRWG
jgi:hypothetical protein